jgi:hypothetical protein
VHAPNEEKNDDSKDSFYGEFEEVFGHFPKYHVKILLEDFNEKLGRDDILRPTIGNGSPHQDNNHNGVRIVNLCTSKNPVIKSMIFPHRHIYKNTWSSSDGKTYNQTEYILIF